VDRQRVNYIFHRVDDGFHGSGQRLCHLLRETADDNALTALVLVALKADDQRPRGVAGKQIRSDREEQKEEEKMFHGTTFSGFGETGEIT
jgi:hypothetical protein